MLSLLCLMNRPNQITSWSLLYVWYEVKMRWLHNLLKYKLCHIVSTNLSFECYTRQTQVTNFIVKCSINFVACCGKLFDSTMYGRKSQVIIFPVNARSLVMIFFYCPSVQYIDRDLLVVQ